jgi:hypothetical protein
MDEDKDACTVAESIRRVMPIDESLKTIVRAAPINSAVRGD